MGQHHQGKHKVAALETINWPPLANWFGLFRLQVPQMSR